MERLIDLTKIQSMITTVDEDMKYYMSNSATGVIKYFQTDNLLCSYSKDVMRNIFLNNFKNEILTVEQHNEHIAVILNASVKYRTVSKVIKLAKRCGWLIDSDNKDGKLLFKPIKML